MTTKAQPRGTTSSRTRIRVAFLGASSTAGKGQAFNWIRELSQRQENRCYEFLNFGVGGDLAYNGLERLPKLIECRPRCAVIWIGANDILAMTFPKFQRLAKWWKKLPQTASPAWFAESLSTIVRRLKTETSAEVRLCSLAPIGEDLFATEGPQSELNRWIDEFNTIIRSTAAADSLRYVPVHETICDQMKDYPRHAFTSFRFSRFYRDAFRSLVLGYSPDKIGEINGWNFHSDGVHLNRHSGCIVAGLVQVELARINDGGGSYV